MEYYQNYGGIFKIRTNPFSNVLVLAEDKYLELILSSSKFLDKSIIYKPFKNWIGLGLITSTGTRWKAHRKMITPTFYFTILQQFTDVFNDIGDILMEKLEKEVGKNCVNIEPFIGLYALDVICGKSKTI